MTSLATITSDCYPFLGSRMAGATASENDFYPIEVERPSPKQRESAQWLFDALDEIDRLAKLPKGWDSYGAEAPLPNLVLSAREIVESIATSFTDISQPSVITATRSGGIQFEWGDHANVYFELEIVGRHRIAFLFVDSNRCIEKEGEIEYQNADEIAPQLGDYLVKASRSRFFS